MKLSDTAVRKAKPKALNPFLIQKQIQRKLRAIFKLLR
jgi:hypothetical protein